MDAPPKRPSIVAEVARSDLRFRDLLIEFPSFWRTFRAFLRAPRPAFAALDSDTQDPFRGAFLFLTEALTARFASPRCPWQCRRTSSTSNPRAGR